MQEVQRSDLFFRVVNVRLQIPLSIFIYKLNPVGWLSFFPVVSYHLCIYWDISAGCLCIQNDRPPSFLSLRSVHFFQDLLVCCCERPLWFFRPNCQLHKTKGNWDCLSGRIRLVATYRVWRSGEQIFRAWLWPIQ